ncbi:MAG: glutamine synthetase, partial [Gammaproteobacteria bacterium]
MTLIKQWFEENRIEEVEAIIPDFAGTARGKIVPADRYLEDNGVRIPEAMFTQTISGEYTDYVDDINPTDIDMEARPVLESLRKVPWASEPTAQIIHNCYSLDGSPIQTAPRYVLKHVLELYKRKGWRPVIAPEIEFYLVKVNTDANQPLEPPVGRSGRQEKSRQTLSLDALNEFEGVVEDIYGFSEIQGLDLETLSHEDGIAQLEVNFKHGDALNLADQVFIFKRTVREAAFKHGMYATFMAKPHQDEPGSSTHLHQSIVSRKTGKNIFINKSGKPNNVFRNYIAGQQTYIPAAMSIFAPNVNSYRRIAPHNSAPINVDWAFDNRTVGLRIPISTAENTRVENRIAGADTNPYLAIAASLASGYLGMQEKLVPTKPLEGSAYENDISLPRDLHSSIDLLLNCKPLRNILGDKFVKLYTAVRELEYETFSQVISSWEREHLLL